MSTPTCIRESRAGAKDTDFCACRWDGEERKVTDFTIAEPRARADRMWNNQRKPLWTGSLGNGTLKLKTATKPTGDALVIFKATDGKEKQILQILLGKFEGDARAKRNAGAALGTSLRERLQAGTLSEGALQATRDEERQGQSAGSRHSLARHSAGPRRNTKEAEVVFAGQAPRARNCKGKGGLHGSAKEEAGSLHDSASKEEASSAEEGGGGGRGRGRRGGGGGRGGRGEAGW